MKNLVKATLILMLILTVIYVSTVVYVHASHKNVVYAATEYQSVTSPIDWYTPEQLGIVNIIEREGGWLHTVVDLEKEPFPLQRENPIFVYKEEFYQISSLWFTPGLTNMQWQVPVGGVLGVAWIFTGVVYAKGRNG